MTSKSASSSKRRKEIVIPVSKIQTKKKSELNLNEQIEEVAEQLTENIEKNPWDIHHVSKDSEQELRARDDGRILVKFPKFVQLIASHDFAYLMEQYSKEDIVISSDLLVDLAAVPYDDPQDGKLAWVFLGGILVFMILAIVYLVFLKV